MKNAFILICLIITVVTTILANQQAENSIVDAGNILTLESIDSYQIDSEQVFGIEQLNEILSIKNCQGIRIYETPQGIFIAGTDQVGNDIGDKVLGFGLEGLNYSIE